MNGAERNAVTRIRSLDAGLLVAVILASLASFLAAGCASGKGATGAIHPGDTFSFEGKDYVLRQVQDDFVLLRFREPGDDSSGLISGYVDEVFRVSRYDLGQGRWYGSSRLQGVYVQWLGLDAFALEDDRAALGGAEVVMLR